MLPEGILSASPPALREDSLDICTGRRRTTESQPAGAEVEETGLTERVGAGVFRGRPKPVSPFVDGETHRGSSLAMRT